MTYQKMPNFLRCYYGDCPSDNSIDPKIIFYEFPKDIERCRMWVKNCNNQELTEMWEKTPDKVATLRICQKHFLPQFLDSSSRLVSHAIPNPIDAEIYPEEMQTCAGLRCNSDIDYTIIDRTIQADHTVNNNGVKRNLGETFVKSAPMTVMQPNRIHTDYQLGADFSVIDPAGMDADAFDSDFEENSLGFLDLKKTLSSISSKNDIERKRRRSRPSLIAPKFLPGTLDLFCKAWDAANFEAPVIDDRHHEGLKNLPEQELRVKVDEAIEEFEDKLLSHAPIIQKNLEKKYMNMLKLIEKRTQESEALANEEEAKGEESTSHHPEISQALTEVRESYDRFKGVELKVKDLLDQLELVERCRMERQ